MRRSIWLLPWDVAGREPEALLDGLQALGMDRIRLALSYHGGRMLLPRHPSRVVVEHRSAVYARVPLEGCGRLQPPVGDETAEVERFLVAARRRGVPVLGWTVLCHQDGIGEVASDCCIENAFGERASYALCPTHPEVQRYVVATCHALARCEVAGLDLEALSYMGLEHQSPHDKRGGVVDPLVAWLLSVCVCPECRLALGNGDHLAARIRGAVRGLLAQPPARAPLAEGVREALGEEHLRALLAMRQRVLVGLLRQVRAAAKEVRLNLRLALDLMAHGGKTAVPLAALPGLVDEATVTFFGAPLDRMREELAGLPPSRPVPVQGGFVFHGPDCTSREDVARRMDLLARAGVEEVAFYSHALASEAQLAWLSPPSKETTP